MSDEPFDAPEPFRNILIEFAAGHGYVVSIVDSKTNKPIDSHYCKDWGLVTETINEWLGSDYH